MKKGKVYLVGGGPGDLGLITVKAVECLKIAEVVLYDHLINAELLHYCRSSAEKIFVGKFPQNHTLVQNEINHLMVLRAKQGKQVVRLKGGDPLLFGRGAEEALALRKAGVDFEIVPGISAAYAVPAYAGIPVTYRGMTSKLKIVSGREASDRPRRPMDWKRLVDRDGTLVIFMGLGNLETIMRGIAAAPGGRALPVAVISRGTCRDQRVVTGKVSDIAQKVRTAGLKPPALVVVGKVVNLGKKLDWFSPGLPLKNRRVLITRPPHQVRELAALLQGCGARVIIKPLIEIVPLPFSVRSQNVFKDLCSFDYVVFTSVNGVEIFVDALKRRKISVKSVSKCRFAAIGRKTAQALLSAGFKVDIVPETFVQEGLADEIIARIKNRKARLLLVHAQGSRPELEDRLREAGFPLETLELYKTLPIRTNQDAVRGLVERREVDAVILTSSSAVDSFVEVFERKRLKAMTRNLVVAVIGPVSAGTAKAAGLPVKVVSREHTIEGVTNALADYFEKRS